MRFSCDVLFQKRSFLSKCQRAKYAVGIYNGRNRLNFHDQSSEAVSDQ